MGTMAESLAAYAQPLIDDTDGSVEQINTAFSIAQICWNLASLPEEEHYEHLAEIRSSLELSDDDYNEFKHSIIAPMIQRHHEMFPSMPRIGPKSTSGEAMPLPMNPKATAPIKGHFKTGRNAPCPCNSGKKYKRCCGR